MRSRCVGWNLRIVRIGWGLGIVGCGLGISRSLSCSLSISRSLSCSLGISRSLSCSLDIPRIFSYGLGISCIVKQLLDLRDQERHKLFGRCVMLVALTVLRHRQPNHNVDVGQHAFVLGSVPVLTAPFLGSSVLSPHCVILVRKGKKGGLARLGGTLLGGMHGRGSRKSGSREIKVKNTSKLENAVTHKSEGRKEARQLVYLDDTHGAEIPNREKERLLHSMTTNETLCQTHLHLIVAPKLRGKQTGSPGFQ